MTKQQLRSTPEGTLVTWDNDTVPGGVVTHHDRTTIRWADGQITEAYDADALRHCSCAKGNAK